MQLSGRQAARILTFPPLSLTERSARHVLACGLAGDPQIGGSTWLYDDTAITALRARPTVTPSQCAERFPNGIFVSRRRVDARWPLERRRTELARGWPIGAATQALLVVRIVQDGFLPFVATIGGFVVDGFDLTGLSPDHRGGHDFALAEPSSWFDELRGKRLPTGPGREWTMPGWEAPRKQRVAAHTPRVGQSRP